MRKSDMEELKRRREHEEMLAGWDRDERERREKYDRDKLADIQRRADAGERFSLGEM